MFKYFLSENSTAPFKARETDSGFDLTIVEKIKQINETTAMYDTGVRVQPPAGYYFDLVPRSSIYKHGYMMYNSVGIIDNEYRGTIKIVLVKVDEEKPELVLPCRLVQLIPRRIEKLLAVETKEPLEETSRQEKGFGSTNK